ncbi:MAG: TonB family protein [Acidobacteriota bacterium]|nr:MAG: TonB family protein [Acidobacteriota bacterium]
MEHIRVNTRLIAYTAVIAIFAGGVISCGEPGTNKPENKPAAPNTSATSPAVTEAKPPEIGSEDTKPAGREIKAADGPALKSVIPPDGAILGGVLNELATTLPAPEFPADSNEYGKVTVEVLVNEKGEVGAASAVDGPQPLRKAAVEAARNAKFAPPLKDGKPVKVGGVLTFERKK